LVRTTKSATGSSDGVDLKSSDFSLSDASDALNLKAELSDFTLNALKVPRPIRVGVTPTGVEAHVIITYAVKTNTDKSPKVLCIFIFLPPNILDRLSDPVATAQVLSFIGHLQVHGDSQLEANARETQSTASCLLLDCCLADISRELNLLGPTLIRFFVPYELPDPRAKLSA